MTHFATYNILYTPTHRVVEVIDGLISGWLVKPLKENREKVMYMYPCSFTISPASVRVTTCVVHVYVHVPYSLIPRTYSSFFCSCSHVYVHVEKIGTYLIA